MRVWRVALGVLTVGVLATAAVGIYVFASVGHTVMHGDEETQMKTAAVTLSCDPSNIVITGMRAVGCERACLLETTGSSATWWSSYTCVLEIPAARAR